MRHCPRCGTARHGTERFCPTCAFDFWRAAQGEAPAASEVRSVTPAPASSRPRWLIPVGILVAVVIAVAIGQRLLGDASDNIADRVERDLAEIGADLPPAGDIWFGSSFDADTFELRGRTTAVGANDAFSLVGRLPSVYDAADLGMRVYLDGQLVASQAFNASGSGDLWGFSPGPLFEPGTWRYEFTDVGGNVLASGEVEATE